MRHSRPYLGISLTGALLLAGLTGCAPTPEPTPTPTALFASDDEAFAAAEETIREYVAADNAWRAGDESIDPLDLLTGEAYADALDARQDKKPDDARGVGDTSVLWIDQVDSDVDATTATVTLHVCLDVSENRVIASDGTDITAPDKADSVLASFGFILDAERAMIERLGLEGTACA